MSANPAPSLKALAENKTAGITKATTFRVNPDLILLQKGFNLRQDNDELQLHIDRLYEAMKAGAMVPPVDVQVLEGEIVARDGHCRTLAARRVCKEIPEFTLECRQLRGNDVDAVVHMLGTGTGGKPLTPLEAGLGYLRLTKMGLTVPQIAAKLGVSRVTVDNGLVLAEAPLEVQNVISSGEVSATTAREAVKQGKEGVSALMNAVEEERKAPTKKKGKRNKVTARKLKGTSAAKKAGKAAPVTPEPAAPVPTPIVNPDTITVSVSKEVATGVFEFLRDFGGTGNVNVDAMKNALETALL